MAFSEQEAFSSVDDVEGGEFSESEVRDAIQKVGTFDELYEVLRGIGEIPGSRHSCGAEDLIKKIKEVHELNIHIATGTITRTAGIREKVLELMRAKDGTVH